MLYLTFILAISLSAFSSTAIKLTEKDSGRTLEMRVGEFLEVVLRGNPTTGYIWSMAAPDNGIIQKVGESEFEPDRQSRGSGGNTIFRFKAVEVGETSLKLIYHRPFEKEKPPINSFETKIIVK